MGLLKSSLKLASFPIPISCRYKGFSTIVPEPSPCDQRNPLRETQFRGAIREFGVDQEQSPIGQQQKLPELFDYRDGLDGGVADRNASQERELAQNGVVAVVGVLGGEGK